MKLWVDDERPAPEGWIWVKTAQAAMLELLTGKVEEISLDHDLASPLPGETGYSVARWIETAAANGRLKRLKWAVHSANPPGRRNIEMALEAADKFWASVVQR